MRILLSFSIVALAGCGSCQRDVDVAQRGDSQTQEVAGEVMPGASLANDAEETLVLSTPKEALDALAEKLATADWEEIENVCTDQGLQSLKALCENFRTAYAEEFTLKNALDGTYASGIYTPERVFKETAAYIRQHPPISSRWFSDDEMRFDLDYPSLLFARTDEGWKLHFWCEEPEIVPWKYYIEKYGKEEKPD